MDPRLERLQLQTRRHFLQQGSLSLGAISLAGLMGSPTEAATSTSAQKTHHAAKAKRVIYLHMTGSPPNLDIYDYKPELVKRSGEDCPQSFLAGREFAFTTGVPKLLGTPRKFVPCGKSGMLLSDAIGKMHRVADEMCLIHSMHTDQFNHAPAELLIYTGSPRAGRPSMGSWVTYGLGSENENLPSFVVLISSGYNRTVARVPSAAAFCPAFIKACSAARKAILSCSLRIRQAWIGRCVARHSMRSRSSIDCKPKRWGILKLKPVFRSTS